MARGMIGPQRGLTVGVDRRSDRAERLEALADVAAVLGTRRTRGATRREPRGRGDRRGSTRTSVSRSSGALLGGTTCPLPVTRASPRFS